MSLVRKALPTWIAVLAAMVGCAQPNACRHYGAAESSVEYALPIVERTPLVGEIGVDIVRATAESPLPPTRPYRALAAREAQCLAVEASLLGDLLDRERSARNKHAWLPSCGCEQAVQLEALRFAGLEARNKSAADALKVYYGIAEAEAGLDAAEASLAEIDDVQRKIDQVRGQALKIPFDASQWDRQRQTLVAKRADLEATRATLNSKMRALLGFDGAANAAYVQPTEPLHVTGETFDAESEVAYGLMVKPELAAIGVLTRADEESTKAAAKALLGDMHGLMGVASRRMLAESLNSMLGVSGREASLRRSQIRELYQSRAGQLANDVRAAVDVIDARRRQAAAAQMQVESRLLRIEELKQRRETGQATFVELGEAQVLLINERAAVTSAVIEWKRAVVELRAFQGALVAECRGGMLPPSAAPTTGAGAVESLPGFLQPLPQPPTESAVPQSGDEASFERDFQVLALEELAIDELSREAAIAKP